MARLEDNPATDAEYTQLRTIPGFEDMTHEEANLLTPDERAEYLSGEDTSDPSAAQAAQDIADGQPDAGHADTETSVDMPHEAAELPVAEQEEDPPAIEVKPTKPAPAAPAAEPEPVAAVVETHVVEAVADEPVADPEPPMQQAPRTRDARDFVALRKDLSAKFAEGEVSTEEFAEQLSELTMAQSQRDNDDRNAVKDSESAWLNQQIKFLDANPEYLPKNSPVRFDALNARVIALAKDPANAGKSGTWHLLEAQRQIEKEIGSGKKVAAVAEAPKPAVVAKPTPPRRPDLKSVPTTLAHVPAAAADDPAEGADEFSRVDKLEGLEYERAIAAMPEAKYDAYMRRSA